MGKYITKEEFYKQLISNEKQWKRLLTSGEKPLFEIHNAKGVIGPQLTEKGEVIGSYKLMEAYQIGFHINDEQFKFWEWLVNHNPQKADEYSLTILGKIDLMKNCIQTLKFILENLKNEENIITHEKIDISNYLQNIEKEKKIRKTLLKYAPTLFDENEELSLTQIFQKLKTKEHETKIRIENISEYLNEEKTKRPFLFETKSSFLGKILH